MIFTQLYYFLNGLIITCQNNIAVRLWTNSRFSDARIFSKEAGGLCSLMKYCDSLHSVVGTSVYAPSLDGDLEVTLFKIA